MTTATLTPLPYPPKSRRWLARRELWVFAMLLGSVLAVGAFRPSFLGFSNAYDLLTDVAPVAILATAQTLVIVTGEIDISVGSLLGLSAAVAFHAVAPPVGSVE